MRKGVIPGLFYRPPARHLDRGRKAGCWWDGGLGGLGVVPGGRGCSVGIYRRLFRALWEIVSYLVLLWENEIVVIDLFYV